MYVYSIAIFKCSSGSKPVLLSIVYEVSSFGFFQRSSVKEISLFVSRESVERTKVGERVSLKHTGKVCHTTVDSNGIGCAVLTDEEYPERVAHSLVKLSIEQFTTAQPNWRSVQQDADLQVPALNDTIIKYQNPSEADPMMKLQNNLGETITIIQRTIEQLNQRGEKLSDIAAKSDDLSFQSKAFMTRAESMNKCCGYV
eukprot:gene4678-5844_t